MTSSALVGWAARIGRSSYFWIAFWGLSIWIGLIHRAGRRDAWFQDYRTLTCAAARRAAHQTMYGPRGSCPGAAGYVYPPWVADGVGGVTHAIGGGALGVLYAAAFFASLGFLIYATLFSRPPEAPLLRRTPFLAFISGGPLAYGNVAIIAHGAIIGSALLFGADSLVFAAVVALFALVKPQFLTLLLLTAFAPAPLWKRGVLAVTGAALPLVMLATPYPGADQWRSFVATAVLANDAGGGFVGWANAAHLGTPATQAFAYLLYAGTIALSGLSICELGRLDRRNRVWVGVTAAVLIMPRLQSYDLLTIGLGCLTLQYAAAQADQRVDKGYSRLWMVAALASLIGATAGGLARPLLSLRLWLIDGALIFTAIVLVRWALRAPGSLRERLWPASSSMR